MQNPIEIGKMKFILFFLIAFNASSQDVLQWKLNYRGGSLNAGDKGSVQEVLIKNFILPNPFYGMNEKLFLEIEKREWVFTSTYFLNERNNSSFIELEFPSIDTYAKVYVNDSLVLSTDNAFIPHAVQIKKYLIPGDNEIKVVFTPPVLYHEERFKRERFHYPAPNDVGEIAVAPYTRKPQYQFGWDWSMRMNTMGFNQKVLIHSYNENRFVNKSIQTIKIGESDAVVELKAFFSGKENTKIVWISKMFGDETVNVKNGVASRMVHIKNPQLWWPIGQGEAFLYKDEWRFSSMENESIHSEKVKFGVKNVELVQEKDEWGTSYYFKINDKRVFGKGADYIPQDVFPARIKAVDIEKMVEQMATSNFNMVRVWGGGYYPDDVFFEKCDELGIMVWQDLMFACAMYPGDSSFLKNVEKELSYQIPRITSHPSVVLINGNNEVDVAWKNWGFQNTYNLDKEASKEIEKSYDALFHQLAPSIVYDCTNIPYIHTSPLSNWGKPEFYNHGSQHYWGVWHGKDPIEDFANKIGRFNAEYGFQSFPEFNTLSSFSEKKDWDIDSEVMKFHQKSYVGNEMIMKHATKLYGAPKDFEEFVYFSQLTQAKAVSMAIAAHRVDSPRCGGTLYWQFNDCWPAPSWSSIDYFGNWKALNYAVQKEYENITVVQKFNDSEHSDFYIVSDNVQPKNVHVKIDVYSVENEFLKTIEVDRIVSLLEGSFLFSLEELKTELKNFQLILKVKITCENHTVYRSFDAISSDFEKTSFDKVKIKIEEKNGDQELILTIKETVRDLWISSSENNVHFERNFETLTKGVYTVRITAPFEVKVEDIKLMWR